MGSNLLNGVVKMFNARKGYGFIHNDEGKDIFFHLHLNF